MSKVFEMGVKVIGTKATIHWLSNEHNNGLLTENHGIMYVPVYPKKKGQVTRDSVTGLTPAQAFEERYPDKSTLDQDLVAEDIIVFDKIHGPNFDYDDAGRTLAHELYTKGKLPFDAACPSYQVAGRNSEALIGYEREQHLDLLLNVTKQSLGIHTYFDTKEPFTHRWHQDIDENDVLTTLLTHKLCLFAAYASRGKTKLSISVATRLLPTGGIVLVTTPITDTKRGFKESINDYHFGNNRQLKTTYMDSVEFAKHAVDDLRKRANNNELIFIVLTVQDARYGDNDLDTLREKYEKLSGQIDLWVRDERHSQYNGEVTSKRLSGMIAKYELDLTATPYGVLDKYKWEHIVARTLLWGLRHAAFTNLPVIRIDALNTPIAQISSACAEVYTAEEGFDPRKLTVRNNNKFVLEAELLSIFNKTYISTLSKDKNPLSIVNDTQLSSVSKQCGLWVLPQGQDGDSAGDYIPDLAKLYNTHFAGRGIYIVDSYTIEKECSKNKTLDNYVQELITEHGRVIILTCGKFLTGTDITPLGHIVLMDKMENIANFEQLLGRMIRTYPSKAEVKMYTFAPAASVKVVLGRMAKTNAKLSSGTVYDVLDCVPLSEYNLTEKSFNVISVEDILTEAQNWSREQVRSKLPSCSFVNAVSHIDITLWDNVDTKSFKNKLPKTALTGKNGAKVKKARAPKSLGKNTNESSKIEQIELVFQSVILEAQWIAVSKSCYDYNIIFKDPVLVQMFGQEIVDAVNDTITQSDEIAIIVRDHMLIKQDAYANLPKEQVWPEVFKNTKHKKGLGLVYVDFNLAEEIIAKNPQDKYSKDGCVILVLNALNGTIPLTIKKNYPNARIVCAEYFDYFVDHLTRLGFEVFKWDDCKSSKQLAKWLKEHNMKKFDVVVGNPPYTAGTKLLYRYFFEQSMGLADTVAFVMPLNLNSKYDSLKELNCLVKTHNTYISENVSDYFNVGQDNIHYVVCDANVTNSINENDTSVFDSYVIKFPDRKRLIPIKGNTAVSNIKVDASGVSIIDKVYRNDEVVYRMVDAKLVASAKQKLTKKYGVFTNHTPSLGKFNVAIVENHQTTWSMSVFAYEVDTLDEANKLKEWLQSEFIIAEVNELLALKNSYAVTLEMLKLLPYYA